MKAAYIGRYWSCGRQLLRNSSRIERKRPPVGRGLAGFPATMSGDGNAAGRRYVVRRGASGSVVTYRPFDNAEHGLEPEFRLLGLADMKG